MVDVFVNSESVVDSEGIVHLDLQDAYSAGDNIIISEGVISAVDTVYEAGPNIVIDNNVISAVDTTYSAGDHIVIDGANVISAVVDEETIGEDVIVTRDVGYYYEGDLIPADTPLKEIIKNMLFQETPPVPPVTDKWLFGAFNEVPTSLEVGWSSDDIVDPQEFVRAGKVQYFNLNRQYGCIAYPQSLGQLTSIWESDFQNVISIWDRSEAVLNGVPYYIYCSPKAKVTNIKEEFRWR